MEFAGTLTLTDDRPVIVRVFAAIAAVVGVVAAPVARVLEPVLLTAVWLVFPAAVLLVLAGHPGLIGLADHPHAVGWLTPLFAAGTVLAIAVVTDLIGDHRATTGRPARTQRRRFGARTPR